LFQQRVSRFNSLHQKSQHTTLEIPVQGSTLRNNGCLAASGGGLSRQNKGDDEAIQRERLGENEDEDHDHEKLWLLRCCAHAGISNNSNANTGGEARKAVGEPGREVSETEEIRVVNFGDVADQDDSDNETLFFVRQREGSGTMEWHR
jgi:hypothetical protein